MGLALCMPSLRARALIDLSPGTAHLFSYSRPLFPPFQLCGSLPELGDWSLDSAPTFMVDGAGAGTLEAAVALRQGACTVVRRAGAAQGAQAPGVHPWV